MHYATQSCCHDVQYSPSNYSALCALQVLEAAWRGDWHEWRLRGDVYKLLSVFPRIMTLPVMAVLCLVAPNLSSVRRWRLPANKMLSWVAAYLVFLALVFIQSNTDKRAQLRGPPTTGLEPVLMVFVAAHVWSLGSTNSFCF